MNQAGLAECIVRAAQACHPYIQPVLYQRYVLSLNGEMTDAILTFDRVTPVLMHWAVFSIILTGGSTLFPRFAERL